MRNGYPSSSRSHGLVPIGEFAARSGVSVRALRFYEQNRLLAPVRTEAGRRVYGAEDAARLQQVLILKRAGCTLARIESLLRQGRFDAAVLLDAQIDAIRRRQDEIALSLGGLLAARQALDQGQAMDVRTLCDLIRLGEETMTRDAWQDVYDRYYTREDQQRWAEARVRFEAGGEEYAAAWTALIARVDEAVANNWMPVEPRSIALAIEWLALQQPLVDQVGTEVWRKAATLYGEMEQWQTDRVRAPFGADTYRFVGEAAAAGRRAGLIPPLSEAA